LHLRDAAPRGHAEAGTTGGGPIVVTAGGAVNDDSSKRAFGNFE